MTAAPEPQKAWCIKAGMKAILSFALFLANVTCIAQAPHVILPNAVDSPTPRASTQVGRYRLVTATVENGNATEPTIFMIDTATGRVWKYQGVFEYHDKQNSGLEPSKFIPIEVTNFSPNP